MHYWIIAVIAAIGAVGGFMNVFVGLAIHRWVLNRLENFLPYSSFQRVTNQPI